MPRFLLLFCVLAPAFLAAALVPQPFQRPLVFEPNNGQAPEAVQWIARAPGYLLMLTAEGATILLHDSSVQMKLHGGRPWTALEGLEPTGGVSNYLLGRDRAQWHTNIPHYARLTAKQVYDGIDLVFYDGGGNLEYDFVVAPGADPNQIRLAFDGVDGMRVDRESGDLLLTTAAGSELRHMRPKVYQQIGDDRVEVAGGYEILDRRKATFMLASYDRKRPLIIDPTVKFNTVLSGNYDDAAIALAVDDSGNAYVTGGTSSTNFPFSGGYQTDQPMHDAFVTKLSPTGAIVFSTYLGGSLNEGGFAIAVDPTGIYVTGETNSPDFPLKNAIYPLRSVDAFVTKLTPQGNALIYSTFLGGSGQDTGIGIAVDPEHGAWVVGGTESEDFPIEGKAGPGQQVNYGGGGLDGFLARIAPDGLSVAFSTFLGGPGIDQGYAVAVDKTGSVYATGFGAKDFPISKGMKPCGTKGGAIVVRLKGRGTQPRYATCVPNAGGNGIAVDANFNAYITGLAFDNLATTPGVYQPAKPAGSPYAAFVTKLGSLGQVTYSTYFGGSNGETEAEDIAVDSSGAVYIGGGTSSTNFPGVPSLPPKPYHGFVSKLTASGSSLAYSKIVGDVITGVRAFQPLSQPPQVYLSGNKVTGGISDGFVAKLE